MSDLLQLSQNNTALYLLDADKFIYELVIRREVEKNEQVIAQVPQGQWETVFEKKELLVIGTCYLTYTTKKAVTAVHERSLNDLGNGLSIGEIIV